MTITFKEFCQVIELSDEEFEQLQEGVLDDAKAFAKKLLGMTPERKAAALAKLETERKKLATQTKSANAAVSARAKEKDDAWAAAMAATKDQGRKGTISHDQAADSIADLGKADRAERRGAASSHLAHRQKNLGMA